MSFLSLSKDFITTIFLIFCNVFLCVILNISLHLIIFFHPFSSIVKYISPAFKYLPHHLFQIYL